MSGRHGKSAPAVESDPGGSEGFSRGPGRRRAPEPEPAPAHEPAPHEPAPLDVDLSIEYELTRFPEFAGRREDWGTQPFLDVRDLRVHFPTEDGVVKSVDGISFRVERGKTLGIVGESGSGKSVTSLSLLGLHKRPDKRGRGGARISGEIWLDGEDLINAAPERLEELRGDKLAMIFQDPLSAMHPYYTVGEQIAEAYLAHNRASKAVARKRTIEMLDRVGIPQPDARVDDYPHQYSGGMRQRAMIAMSLICNPELLIADEPTTALDVTVQAQILDLMRDLQQEFNSALIIITHDLGVVAELADDIMVMYAGKAVEYGPAKTVFTEPEHPYTWGLLGSMPRLDRAVQARLLPIPGSPPSLINVPAGCAFHPRCRFAELIGGRCTEQIPQLADNSRKHLVSCHLRPDQRRSLFAERIAPQL